MQWTAVEWAFLRAVRLTFSKNKLMLAIPALFMCGAMFLFCNALKMGSWASISLTLLPFFLSFPILAPLGICLIRLHHHEAKKIPLSWKELVESSSELILPTSYLALFPLFTYLLIGLFLGLFFLLLGLPVIGKLFGVLLSFVPFLLLTLSFLLLLGCLFLLFFFSPLVALQKVSRKIFVQKMGELFKERPFSSFSLFLIGLLPMALIGGILWLAASWSMGAYVEEGTLLHVLEGFFIMIPFAVFLSIPLIFFFNFSAECLQLLRIAEE